MSLSKPIVSIIVIAYNQEDFIEQCLLSILEQDCDFYYEVILSDDASTDGTFELAERIAKDFSQLVLLRNKKNLGPAGNFAKALSHCKGELIAFCEGDDYWCASNKLRLQVETMRGVQNATFCYADYKKVDEKGAVLSESSLQKQPGNFDMRDLLETHGPTINSLIVRKSVFPTKLPSAFFKVLNPDVFIMAWAIEKGKGIFINKTLSAYRLQSSGIWSSLSQIEKDVVRYSTFSVVLRNLGSADKSLKKEVRKHLFHLLRTVRSKGYAQLFKTHFGFLSMSDKIRYLALRSYHRLSS